MDLTGRLVRLRGLREADVPRLVEILADPVVTAALPLWALRPIGAEDVRRLIHDTAGGSVRWAVEELPAGCLVGMAALVRVDTRDRNADLEVVIGPPDRWGRGLGTDACRLATTFALAHLSVEKVTAAVPATNPAARCAAERAGYVLEGVQRRHELHDGNLVDLAVLAAFVEEEPWREAVAWT